MTQDMHDPALTALFGDDLHVQDKTRKWNEREQRELLDAVRAVLEAKTGRLFVWWLLEQAHVFQNSFTGNSSTFFLEGERNVGLKLFALCMEADPEFMRKLLDFKREAKTGPGNTPDPHCA